MARFFLRSGPDVSQELSLQELEVELFMPGDGEEEEERSRLELPRLRTES